MMPDDSLKQAVLKSDRLILRPFELADASDVQRLAGNWTIADTTLNIPHPYEDGMAEEWISTHKEKLETGGLATYAIVEKSEATNARIEREAAGVDRRAAQFREFADDSDNAFLRTYIDREGWGERFGEARTELEHSRAR